MGLLFLHGNCMIMKELIGRIIITIKEDLLLFSLPVVMLIKASLLLVASNFSFNKWVTVTMECMKLHNLLSIKM